MQVKIKNGILIQDEFLIYFQRLLKRRMPAKLCMELNVALDEIVSQVTALKRTRLDLAMQYGLKENNQVKLDTKGDVIFPDESSKEACLKEINSLYNESFTIEISQSVKIYEDEEASPDELRYLGELIEVMEKPKEISPQVLTS